MFVVLTSSKPLCTSSVIILKVKMGMDGVSEKGGHW